MGASPSHEDDGDEVAETEDSDDDDNILKMKQRRYRVRIYCDFTMNTIFVARFAWCVGHKTMCAPCMCMHYFSPLTIAQSHRGSIQIQVKSQ